MAGESLARRYAQAAFELAQEQRQPLDAWLGDIETMEQVLGNDEVHAALASPKLPFERKRELLDRAASGLDPLRRNFFYLLVEKNRIDLIGPVAREFRRMYNEHQGIAEATITTAVPISDAEAGRIAEQLGRLVGKKVVLERRVDPSIIGGVVARVGDTLINGSVAGRLAALQEQLTWS